MGWWVGIALPITAVYSLLTMPTPFVLACQLVCAPHAALRFMCTSSITCRISIHTHMHAFPSLYD
jgi:hypothetical protein